MQRCSVVVVFSVLTFISQMCFAYDFSAKHKKNAEALMAAGLSDEVGYDLVESLTTEVGQRLAGSEAEKRARDWAVKKFKAMGFKNVRVEEFKVPEWERGIEVAEVTVPFPQKLAITALGGSIATPEGGVEGELVRFPSLAALAAVENNALKGKIVFIDESMSRTQDGSGYSAAVAKRGKTAYEAYRVGASAALIRSVGTSSRRFPHTGVMKTITEIHKEPSVPAAALSAPDADQLARMLERTDSVRLRITLTPTMMPESISGNVIAEIPGRKNPEDIVLLGAHLDSWDLGTGAVDDGAGVGIVMAAASLVKKVVKKRPDKTIRVVLFGSEEVGLIGAWDYTNRYSKELGKHIFAAESDFGADVIWRFGSANVAKDKFSVIKAVQQILAPLKINLGDDDSWGGPDLLYMKQAGVPVADLKQNGTDYFDLHHTADDTVDKIEKGKLQQNIAAYAAVAYLIANIEGDLR